MWASGVGGGPTVAGQPAHAEQRTARARSVVFWKTDPKIDDGTFEFNPPATATEIDFLFVDAGNASVR